MSKTRSNPNSDVLRRAYSAGFKDGQGRAERLIECAVTSNKALWEEVLRLDDESPGDDVSVKLSFIFVEYLIKLLRSSGNTRDANRLEHRLNQAKSSRRVLLRKLQRLSKDLEK